MSQLNLPHGNRVWATFSLYPCQPYRGVWRCGGAQSVGVRLTEQDLAAIRIQTKYRQHRARQHVAAVREQRAAVKIQAGYHGWVARKEVRRIRSG